VPLILEVNSKLSAGSSMISTCAAFFGEGSTWASVGVENSRLPIVAAVTNLKSVLFIVGPAIAVDLTDAPRLDGSPNRMDSQLARLIGPAVRRRLGGWTQA
jgi:hypothetical protein